VVFGILIQCHLFPAELYADALAAQPDRLIEAWHGSAEKVQLQKKVEAIHSGQGSIAEVITTADKANETLIERAGFYHQAPFYTQIWQLFYRQVLIYMRNPVMSTSRLFAAVIVGLFFGGAFWQLQRNVQGYEGRAAEGFSYKLMTAGFGSAAIAYWVEKRKVGCRPIALRLRGFDVLTGCFFVRCSTTRKPPVITTDCGTLLSCSWLNGSLSRSSW
jgi:hypothetical protein